MKTKSIYNLAVVPYIIADRAAWGAIETDERCKGWTPMQIKELADKVNPLLCDRAELHYQQGERFYKQMNKRNIDQRYYLEMFMEHWCYSLLDNYFKGEPLEFKVLESHTD
jgi:hypothetical protein